MSKRSDLLCAFATKSPPAFLDSFSLSLSPEQSHAGGNESLLSMPAASRDMEDITKSADVAISERKESMCSEELRWDCSPAPRPEPTVKRPNSSQSMRGLGRTVSPTLDPTHFNRAAFPPFLKEFLVWLGDEQTFSLSVSIKQNAECLRSDMEKGKLLDVPKSIRLMRELEPFSGALPPLLGTLFMRARTRPAPDPAVLQAKAKLEQSASAITFKKLSDLKSAAQPSAEVEVICLAFLLLLSHLDGSHVLSLHRNAWKAFQMYLQQPGRCLQVLKRTAFCIESGSVGDDLIGKLRGKVEKISENALKGSDVRVASGTIFRYLWDTIELHKAVWPQSLYAREGSGALKWEESPRVSFGEGAEKPVSPHFANEDDQGRSMKETDDVELRTDAQLLSDSTHVCNEVVEGAATARFPVKLERRSGLSRSKSSTRVSSAGIHRGVSRLIKERNLSTSVDFSGRTAPNKDASRPKPAKKNLNWSQQQLLREKERLVRGMQKLAQMKAAV